MRAEAYRIMRDDPALRGTDPTEVEEVMRAALSSLYPDDPALGEDLLTVRELRVERRFTRVIVSAPGLLKAQIHEAFRALDGASSSIVSRTLASRQGQRRGKNEPRKFAKKKKT